MYDYRDLQPAAAARSTSEGRVDPTLVDYHELMALGRAEQARAIGDMAGRAWRWLRRLASGR